MNLKSAFTWEDAKQVAEQVVFNKMGMHLSDIEIEVLQAAWEGLTYEKMAEEMAQRSKHKKFYSADYLRGDVGFKLFRQKLSSALAEDVSKTNFKGALERAWQKRQQQSSFVSNVSHPISSLKTELIFPEGSVPLNSPLYLERSRVESICYEAIDKAGSLIRIKAPKLMGKTSLMARIIAQGKLRNYRTAYLDLSSVERGIVKNLDKLLRWLCLMVSRQLKVENKLDHYWDTEILGSNDNCTVYFEEYLLAEIESPLVLALDNVERVFPYAEVVEDFLGMLRSWHEKGKISSQWKQLRLVMAHSTECYIPLDMNQSPFNAGIPVELLEFNHIQVKDLACLHGLNADEFEIEKLMGMVGGHPYLVRLALYEISSGQMTLQQLLSEASTEAGIYSNHLRRHLEVLQQAPELSEALKQVVASLEPVALNSMQIYKLHSMGLVKQKNNQVMPRCHLYREYFHRVL